MSQLSTCPTLNLFDRRLTSIRCARARVSVLGESASLLGISSVVLVPIRSSITSVILFSVATISLSSVLLSIYPLA